MEVKELIERDTDEQVVVFSTLADPTRLRIVKLLCHKQFHDALCVNALAAILGVTQSAVSQHLRILKSIGLVKGERRGYHVHYLINPDVLGQCQGIVSTLLTIEEPSKGEKSKNPIN